MFTCHQSNSYMDRLVLGEVLSVEEEKSLQVHIQDCSFCKERLHQTTSFSKNMESAFKEVSENFTSPKKEVLKIIEKNEFSSKANKITAYNRKILLWSGVGLMIVLFVFSYIGLVTAYKLWHLKNSKKIQKDMAKIIQKLEIYKKQHGLYPPNMNLPHVKPLDPWGNPYSIRFLKNSSKKFMIYSFGKNQKNEHGFGDDLWSKLEIREKIYMIEVSFLTKGVDIP